MIHYQIRINDEVIKVSVSKKNSIVTEADEGIVGLKRTCNDLKSQTRILEKNIERYTL